MTREGDRRISVLTGKVYEVRTIKDGAVFLQSLDGSSRVWTEEENLRLFYDQLGKEWHLDSRRKKVDFP